MKNGWWAGLSIAVLSATVVFAEDEPRRGGLFERLDKNGDGVIKADEVDERGKRLFERLLSQADKNEDGALTKEEAEAGLAGRQRPTEQIGGRPGGGRFEPGAMLKRIDKDEDGKISQDEAVGPLKQNFDKVDENGDGYLTQDEIRGAFAKMRGQMSDRIAAALKEMDANGDGKISVDEAPEGRKEMIKRVLERTGGDAIEIDKLKEMMGRFGGQRPGNRPGQGDGAGAIMQRLKQADADANGKLSKEEAPERLKARFDDLDANGDGELEEKELKALFERIRQRQQE